MIDLDDLQAQLGATHQDSDLATAAAMLGRPEPPPRDGEDMPPG